MEGVKTEAQTLAVRLSAKHKRMLQAELADCDETAEPVTATGGHLRVVEYRPDTQLRFTEQIPLQEKDGVEGFQRRAVMPYCEAAWYVPSTVKIGCESCFSWNFHKPEPMRPLERFGAWIAAVEREAEGVLGGVLGGGPVVANRELRVYTDSTVAGGYEDDEVREVSSRLVQRCAPGEITPVASALLAENTCGLGRQCAGSCPPSGRKTWRRQRSSTKLRLLQTGILRAKRFARKSAPAPCVLPQQTYPMRTLW